MTARTFVYDGDCGVCSQWVRWYETRRGGIPCTPWRVFDLTAIGLSEGDVRDAAWLVGAAGDLERGHRAIAGALRAMPDVRWRAAGRALTVPVLSTVAAFVYSLVARSRHRLPGASARCAMRAQPATASTPGAPTSRGRDDGPTRPRSTAHL